MGTFEKRTKTTPELKAAKDRLGTLASTIHDTKTDWTRSQTQQGVSRFLKQQITSNDPKVEKYYKKMVITDILRMLKYIWDSETNKKV